MHINIRRGLNVVRLQKHFPQAYRLFMMIAEPRVVRLLHLGIYLCMLLAGLGVILQPPHAFDKVVGRDLVFIFGWFVFLGAILAAFAVLPGIWWLERVGLISLVTGMAIYITLLITLGASIIGLAIPVAFILTFVIRWLEIRRYQLAPRGE